MKLLDTRKLIESITNVGEFESEKLQGVADAAFADSVNHSRKLNKEVKDRMDKFEKEASKDLDNTEKDRTDVKVKSTPELKKMHLSEDLFEAVLTEDEPEEANPKASGNENNGNDATQEFKKLEYDLQNASSYEAFINMINKIMANEDQFKIFKAGLQKIDTTKAQVQQGSIAVSAVLPTQSEIDASNSLSWFLNGGGTREQPNEANVKSSFANLFAGVAFKNKPPIVFNGKYVIDGHHRWSQAYCADKNNKIEVVNFKFEGDSSPIDALKRFQVAIAATSSGSLPSAKVKQGLNLYSMSEDQIRKFIDTNMCDLCLELTQKHVPEVKDRQQAIDYYTANCMALKSNNKPVSGAPNRALMPQTTDAAVKVAAQPMTDFTGGKAANESVESARPYHNDLLAAIEDGFVDYETVAKAALKYMSDDDIKELCRLNDFNIEPVEDLNESDSDPHEISMEEAVNKIIEKFGNNAHKYRLKAEEYVRYGAGRVYTKTFKAPNDYLALFSMVVHGKPSPDNLEDAFEPTEILDLLKEHPTFDALLDFATSVWWGDGDDYIISLTNLDTGNVLYEADYEVEDYDESLHESDKPAATSIEDAQKWVDYDMKKYGKISARTNRLVKKAGFQIIKDDHGDYEVAAGKFESIKEDLVIVGGIEDFKTTSDISATILEKIKSADKLADLDKVLEKMYPEGAKASDINDVLESEDGAWILRMLDIEDKEKEVDADLEVTDTAIEA